MLQLNLWSGVSLYPLLILSITVSSVTLLPPNVHAWTAGEKPALCPAGTWDTWRADWESMTSVDVMPSTPPKIGSNFLVVQYTHQITHDLGGTILVWNESIQAGTESNESKLYFPEGAGGGYVLQRLINTTGTHLDVTIWTQPTFGNPDTLVEWPLVGCIIASSGIVSHPYHPYAGTDTSWFNHNSVADSTPPVTSKPVMNPQLILFRNKVTFSAKAVDAQSGVSRGEFFIDKDPGKGKGTPMTFKNGKIVGSTTIKNLKFGKHTLYMRAVDVAGNWSKPVYKQFIYIGFSR